MIGKALLILFGIITISCSNSNREVTIFSIPNNTTPSKLEENGFVIERDLNSLGEVDKHYPGKIRSCSLNMVYAIVRTSYENGDTTTMKRYDILIDIKPFQEMTGFKAKNYASLEIEGFKYRVKVNDDRLSLRLKRLGL